MYKYINHIFSGISTGRCLFVTSLACLLLGILDYLSGPELSFSIFYTVPIMLATWYGGKASGLVVMILSASCWMAADLVSGNEYSTLFIPLWNTLVRVIFFMIIWQLLLALRAKLALEESLADTDVLTGLANRRFFQEQLEREFERVERYPEVFTIAYFDLDNFKTVNDTLGHDEGDRLLQVVAHTLSVTIRRSDYAARLGGDEFVVLFPLLDKGTAMVTLSKLQDDLLLAMQEYKWPVTFSIGAVTFTKNMSSSLEMLKKVDDLMYEVKKSGKNNIRHVIWPEEE